MLVFPKNKATHSDKYPEALSHGVLAVEYHDTQLLESSTLNNKTFIMVIIQSFGDKGLRFVWRLC